MHFFKKRQLHRLTRHDQLIKSDIGKPIDKSLSIDKIMFIDIDCIDQSMKIDTHNFSSQNQSIFIDFIDLDFIDKRKTSKNAYMF